MADEQDCLICGRPPRPTGEPDCECVTHSLSRPVGLPQQGPDPADVALFPVDLKPGVQQGDSFLRLGYNLPGSHRKPRHRARIAVAAGGAVAAVVGCTALAASLLGGQDRPGRGVEETGPSLALPDGGTLPEQDQEPSGEGEETPNPEETDGTPEPDETESRPPESATPGPSASGDSDPTSGTEDPPVEAPSADDAVLVLSEGDTGGEVVELQRRLRQLGGFYHGGFHGRFDAETREGVELFQEEFGVQGDPTGVYGTVTRTVLEQNTAEP